MKKTFKLSVTLGLVMTSLTAQAATLTPNIERGEKNVYYKSPNGIEEVCVIPAHYPEASYKQKDLDKEVELCNYSFYQVSEAQAAEGKMSVRLDAKSNSTNPGVNIYSKIIEPGKTEAEKIGKYKNSTSCSYTPSILSYYHVSRILGGIGRVPVSVLRSMDIEVHKKIAASGVSITNGKGLINETWKSLQASLIAGASSSKKDLLMTDDARQSYGAFIVNPKGEIDTKKENFSPLFNSGADRAVAFRDNNAIFSLVKDKRSIEAIASNKWDKANLQKLVTMREATEFIILDHILDQQDRFGNIAYQPRVAYIVKDKEGNLDLELSGDMKDYEKHKAKGVVADSRQPLSIFSVILKDNDCGVSKSNVVKKAGLLERVAHMSPKTYKKLIEFQRTVRQNESFFTSNLMFTRADYNEMVANLDDAANIVQRNCKSGALKLDLDIDQLLTVGSVQAASCDVP